MRPLRLIFLGPPGTGKGTQAQRLQQQLGIVPLSSGDVLRREIKEGSEVGRQAAEYVHSGRLVPDDLITRVVLAALDRLPASPGWALDGFPRTAPQAEALAAGLSQRGLSISAVIDLVLSDDEILRRIVDRRVCGNCGATYNVSLLPPKVAGVCDRCGGGLTQRADDTRDVIQTRLETYRSQTAPLVEYYRQRGLLREIDASKSADSVARQILAVVQRLETGA